MRLFVSLADSLTATASPTLACPPGALCVIDAQERSEVPAPKRPVSLQLHHDIERTPWRLDVAAVKQPEPELPWIWSALRAKVETAMPTYRDRDLTLSLAPVVISGSFDTVPGVGVAGDF
jgi:hypothetical protein